jgi:hypothetical protein
MSPFQTRDHRWPMPRHGLPARRPGRVDAMALREPEGATMHAGVTASSRRGCRAHGVWGRTTICGFRYSHGLCGNLRLMPSDRGVGSAAHSGGRPADPLWRATHRRSPMPAHDHRADVHTSMSVMPSLRSRCMGSHDSLRPPISPRLVRHCRGRGADRLTEIGHSRGPTLPARRGGMKAMTVSAGKVPRSSPDRRRHRTGRRVGTSALVFVPYITYFVLPVKRVYQQAARIASRAASPNLQHS